MGSWEIVISIDGLRDGTFDIADKFSKGLKLKNRFVRILPPVEERLGKGGGIKRAVSACQGETICIMDVDMSAHPSQIPSLVKEMGDGSDLVIASRYLAGSKFTYDLVRFFLSKAYNYLVRLTTGLNISDTQCGFKAFKKEMFLSIEKDVISNSFAFDVDLLLNSIKHGYKIREVPIEWHQVKETSLHIRDIPVMFFDLIEMRKRVFN